MKKNKTFTSGLFVALIAIITLSLCTSCGNKKGNNLSIPGIDFASAEVGTPEWLNELTPIPVTSLVYQDAFHTNTINKNIASEKIPAGCFDTAYDGVKGVAFKEKNGEYIMFDNDENYDEWCAPLYLFHRVFSNYFNRETRYNEFKKLGVPLEGPYYSTVWIMDLEWWVNHPEKIKEYGKIELKYFQEAYYATMQYLMGDKDKITNKVLYKIIDKQFYDRHINDRYFTLKSSEYGRKKYISPYTIQTGLGGIYDNADAYVTFEDIEESLLDISLTQGELPTGTLVCNY